MIDQWVRTSGFEWAVPKRQPGIKSGRNVAQVSARANLILLHQAMHALDMTGGGAASYEVADGAFSAATARPMLVDEQAHASGLMSEFVNEEEDHPGRPRAESVSVGAAPANIGDTEEEVYVWSDLSEKEEESGSASPCRPTRSRSPRRAAASPEREETGSSSPSRPPQRSSAISGARHVYALTGATMNVPTAAARPVLDEDGTLRMERPRASPLGLRHRLNGSDEEDTWE